MSDKNIAFQITIDVEDISKGYVLQQHIGDGEFGEHKIVLSSSIPNGSPIIKIGDARYTVNIHEIVQAICGIHVGAQEGDND